MNKILFGAVLTLLSTAHFVFNQTHFEACLIASCIGIAFLISGSIQIILETKKS